MRKVRASLVDLEGLQDPGRDQPRAPGALCRLLQLDFFKGPESNQITQQGMEGPSSAREAARCLQHSWLSPFSLDLGLAKGHRWSLHFIGQLYHPPSRSGSLGTENPRGCLATLAKHAALPNLGLPSEEGGLCVVSHLRRGAELLKGSWLRPLGGPLGPWHWRADQNSRPLSRFFLF